MPDQYSEPKSTDRERSYLVGLDKRQCFKKFIQGPEAAGENDIANRIFYET